MYNYYLDKIYGKWFEVWLTSVSAYQVPGRNRTSFERRSSKNTTSYTPNVQLPQAYSPRSNIVSPVTSVAITPKSTPPVQATSSGYHAVTPVSAASSIRLQTQQYHSQSQPSLVQTFQNLNIANDNGSTAAPTSPVYQNAPVNSHLLSNQAVKRSQSFTSPRSQYTSQNYTGQLNGIFLLKRS